MRQRIIWSILLLACTFSSKKTIAQCNINFCTDAPVLRADTPYFDAETSSIVLDSVTIGKFGCDEEVFVAGLNIYVYQLLPTGERMFQCTVLNPPPNNTVGYFNLGVGPVSTCNQPEFTYGTLQANEENGFIACDGATYEIELVLYITEVEIEPFLVVYDQIPESQYIVNNLGTIDVHLTDAFPGNGQPLTTARIEEFPSGAAGTIELNCGESINVAVEALSRLSNCPPLEDVSTGVPSEMTNEFYYSVNGGTPVILQDPSTGAAGGQLTGVAGQEFCYGGVLGVRTIEFSELPALCEGSTIVFTVNTTDIFTNQTVEDEITFVYTGAACEACPGIPGCIDETACNYDADATEDDGSCTYAEPNFDCEGNCIATVDCAGTCGGTAIEDCENICDGSAIVGADCTDIYGNPGMYNDDCTCELDPIVGCTDIDACNYNPLATVNDDVCLYDDCLGECGGLVFVGTACDDGDPTTTGDVYDINCNCSGETIPGCTDDTACNYNPEATIDDESCRFESYYFNCNCDEPCPAGFDQDETCNCISQCGPTPNPGEDTVLSICGNDAPFDLYEALSGTPEQGGEWYYQSKAEPLGAITNFTFTPGISQDGVYLYFFWQGDECESPSATVQVTTNPISQTDEEPVICEGETYTLPNGEVVSTEGNYETILSSVENCDSVINTGLIVQALDCLGVCGGSATAGTTCDDGDPATTGDVYDGNCNCVGEATPGCIDDTACNYNPEATVDDGSCSYPETNFDCEGNCIVETDCAGTCGGTATTDCENVCGGYATEGAACTDSNGLAGVYGADCICFGEPTPGCTDDTACNYNPDATVNDGYCTYPETNFDCNGNCLITVDCAGTCGGMELTDCEGVCAGSALPGVACTDLDGNSGTYDNDCNCTKTNIPGCTDQTACNYNGDATVDDGSCVYQETNFDCYGNCLVDEDCEGICNGSATPGSACIDINGNPSIYGEDCVCIFTDGGPSCTDPNACNTGEQGGCIYPDAGYDCNGDCIVGEDCAGNCGGSAISGSVCIDAFGNISIYLDDCSCQSHVEPGICNDPDACNSGMEGVCIYAPPGAECPSPNCPTMIDCTGECGGTATEDCMGICGGPAILGASCDDGDPNTNNEVFNASCECVGTSTPDECLSVGGTLGLTEGGNYSNLGFICDGETVVVDADDFLLLSGQVVTYVFHEDGIVNSTSELQNILQIGSFFTNDGFGKKEIYVTAYGAKRLENGEPDFSDPCIVYSNTLTITLLNPIEISIEEECEPTSGEFSFSVTITGGLPECVPSTSYEVSGDYLNGLLTHGETQMVGPIADAENYNVTATDDNGCTYSVSKSVNCTKLPIELISFEGEALESGNQLKWISASEIENDYYIVEASANGIDFKTITSVKGKGTTSSTSSYTHLDRTASKGITYYRLSQTDFDGTNAQVKVIAVERGETSFNITDLYPIPTSDFIHVDFMAPEQTVVDIEVYDLIGRSIESIKITSTGSNQLKLEVTDYAVGVYFISVQSDNNHKVTQ